MQEWAKFLQFHGARSCSPNPNGDGTFRSLPVELDRCREVATSFRLRENISAIFRAGLFFFFFDRRSAAYSSHYGNNHRRGTCNGCRNHTLACARRRQHGTRSLKAKTAEEGSNSADPCASIRHPKRECWLRECTSGDSSNATSSRERNYTRRIR
jgi:hypothetical protein